MDACGRWVGVPMTANGSIQTSQKSFAAPPQHSLTQCKHSFAALSSVFTIDQERATWFLILEIVWLAS